MQNNSRVFEEVHIQIQPPTQDVPLNPTRPTLFQSAIVLTANLETLPTNTSIVALFTPGLPVSGINRSFQTNFCQDYRRISLRFSFSSHWSSIVRKNVTWCMSLYTYADMHTKIHIISVIVSLSIKKHVHFPSVKLLGLKLRLLSQREKQRLLWVSKPHWFQHPRALNVARW